MSHMNYVLAGGGTIGRDHRVAFRNYQDAYTIHRYDFCTVAIVTDGCSSGSRPDSSHNEVGARLGAGFLVQAIAREVAQRRNLIDVPSDLDWEKIAKETQAEIAHIVVALGIDEDHKARHHIQDLFLFTIAGVVLTDLHAYFFSFGDGIIIVNGVIYEDNSYNNQPPYLGYRLMQNNVDIFPEEDLQFKVLNQLPLAFLDDFLIGCDGVKDLLRVYDRKLPGLDREVGLIEQFWEDDRYFNGNPDLISRQLRLIGRDWPRVHPEPGLLPDDTTIVVGRRGNRIR